MRSNRLIASSTVSAWQMRSMSSDWYCACASADMGMADMDMIFYCFEIYYLIFIVIAIGSCS